MSESVNRKSGSPTRIHDIDHSQNLKEFMSMGWDSKPSQKIEPHQSIPFTKRRRNKISEKYLGTRIIFPAGNFKPRNNDVDYKFRAHSDFCWCTGIISEDCIPNSVLIMEPTNTGHDSILFLERSSSRNDSDFYEDTKFGEFWVGKCLSFYEIQIKYNLMVLPLEDLKNLFNKDCKTIVVRGVDKTLDDLVKPDNYSELLLLNTLSEMRMIKDQYEINEIQAAVDSTIRGFADMVKVFQVAKTSERGERIIESAFNGRARIEGNDNGYPPIVAAGSNACILHWIKNSGDIKPNDLVLIDAGVELDSHYTADITRTFPVSGKFTKAQRDIYNIVFKAQCSGIAAIKPGIKFKDIHEACMLEVAKGAFELGVLPISFEESLRPEMNLHRRWQFHGSGHHLGIDVHDCSQARKENYLEGQLVSGMVLTVEPGFYIQPDDILFPKEYRGIGVRIEDDILVTQTGAKILSNSLPRHPDEIETYMAKLLQ